MTEKFLKLLTEHEPTPPPPPTDEIFGGCPECGQFSGWVNIGRVQWVFCETHGLKWWIGDNLLDGWREETEDVWRANAAKLQGMLEVKPVYPDPDNADPSKGAADITDDEVPF